MKTGASDSAWLRDVLDKADGNAESLRVHQVRYGVDILPYDLAWNGTGLILLGIGAALAIRATSRRTAQPDRQSWSWRP